MIDLVAREQVAVACGWTDIKPLHSSIWGSHSQYKSAKDIPEYELSIDAIAAEFDKKGWDWVVVEISPVKYRAVSLHAGCSFYVGKTRAIALCNLFLAINEENK